MVDITGLPGTPTASDFISKIGNDSLAAGWATASDPASITVRPGESVSGSDRVTLIWNDNNLDATTNANEAVAGQWLEVIVKATANTGLAAADVFYFGNAPGKVGNSASDAVVDTTDVLLPFNHQTAGGAAPLTSAYDINRDRSVDTTDVLLPFYNQTGYSTALLLLDLSLPVSPSPKPAFAAMSMSAVQLADLLAGCWTGTNSGGNAPIITAVDLVTVTPWAGQLGSVISPSK